MKARIISGTVEWRSNVIACKGITYLNYLYRDVPRFRIVMAARHKVECRKPL